jgi:cation diffusion facilitator CzcD-associated flavoprotein CzcO
MLRNIPLAQLLYRLWTALQLEVFFFAFRTSFLGGFLRRLIASSITTYMKETAAERYHDILIPKYELGAKRPVMDHGYLAATHKPNFSIVKCNGIKAVVDSGRTIVDASGGEHAVDLVVLANGFKTQELLAPMEIYGLDGSSLRKSWKSSGGARAYMG